MKVSTDLKLGQSTNLLNGYRTDLFKFLKPSNNPALFEQTLTLKYPQYNAKWSLPTVTFHDNAEDLISALIQTQVKIKTQPFEDKLNEGRSVAYWPAGSLRLTNLSPEARLQTLQEISNTVGLDLTKKGWSYAVVRRSRKVGTVTHTACERGYSASPDAGTLKWNAMASLKALETVEEESTEVGKNGANGYLDFFETYGTHFISSVDVGDSLFQVFAYTADEYQNIIESYPDHKVGLSVVEALAFVQFTVPTNAAGYGHAAAIGTVNLTSRNPKMASSLKNGQWHDPKFAKTNSIFAPYVREDAIKVNEELASTWIGVISVDLNPLSIFTDDYRKLIWHRVFKAAMYTRYAEGPGVAPYFSNNCPYDLDSAYMDSDPIEGDGGLLSTIATPNVSLWKERIDLSTIDLQCPDLIKHFSVFAGAVQIPTPSCPRKSLVQVPGSDTVTIISHVITSGEDHTAIPPAIYLSDSAFDSITEGRLHCGEFYGGLRLINTESKKYVLVSNGLIFKEIDGYVRVVHDIRELPPPKVLGKHFSNVEFSLVAAEARLEFLLGQNTDKEIEKKLARHFLFWLADLAAQCETLIAVQARATHLAMFATQCVGTGVAVPVLRFAAYKNVVESVKAIIEEASIQLTNLKKEIQDRKREEREIDREKALNANIIQSGKLLQSYIKAQATHQDSLAEATTDLVNQKRKDLDSAYRKSIKLNKMLAQAKETVANAVTAYEAGVKAYQRQEMIKATCEIILNIFAIGLAVFNPSSAIDSLAKLGQIAQKIQKAINVFEAVIKTIEKVQGFAKIPTDPKVTLDALASKGVGKEGVELPSELEWDELSVGVTKALSGGPDISEKADLIAAFSIMVLRGKALLESQSTVNELMNQIQSSEQRIELTKEHRHRLDDLEVNLNAKPEEMKVEEIDLVGLSGQLGFFERQMLMTLASVVALQDRALQYEYLQPPTSVGSFTMSSLKLAILNQYRSLNLGLHVDPHPETQDTPIVYEVHGVDPGSITDKSTYSFDIPLDSPEFASYNYVRILKLDVEILGITASKDGKYYYTELIFDGHPFWDRSWTGEKLKFQTSSRKFTSVHDVNPSSKSSVDQQVVTLGAIAKAGDNPFHGNISNITPFSRWEVALPPSDTNGTREEMKFDDESGVTIRITFHIFAQLLESWVTPSPWKPLDPMKKNKPAAPITTIDAPQRKYRRPRYQIPEQEAQGDLPKAEVAEKDVLKMMSGKSVCSGWDAVLCVPVGKVNEKLQQQYVTRQGNQEFMTNTGDVIMERVTTDGIKIKTSLNFNFNAPRLQFRLNSDFAQIILPIISGSCERSILADDRVVSSIKVDIEENETAFIQGIINLSSLTGRVSSQHSVAISLSDGAFSASEILVSVSDPSMGAVLIDFFTDENCGHKGEAFYSLGTLDPPSDVPVSLKPSLVQFGVCRTSSCRDLLQVFMSTSSSGKFPRILGVEDPIPSNYECALIISSRVYCGDIMQLLLSKSDIDLSTLSAKKASGIDCGWIGEAISCGRIKVEFPAVCYAKTHRNLTETISGAFMGDWEYFVKVDKDVVLFNVRSLKFQSGDKESEWNIKMILDVCEQDFHFQHGSRYYYYIGWSRIDYNPACIKADLEVSSCLKLSVNHAGIHITSSATTVLPIHVQRDNAHWMLNHNVPEYQSETQKGFVRCLQTRLTEKLAKVFEQARSSGGASVYALTNVLFPGSDNPRIRLEQVRVPGDMILFGNFT